MRFLFFNFILIYSFFTAQNVIPNNFEAKVIGVSDGDSFKVLYKNKEIKIRLNHIDAPERGQDFGKKAQQYASNLCFGKKVRIIWYKKDRYQRIIADIFINGNNLNKKIVKDGYAWHFKKYSTDKEYDKLEKEARKNKRGLWSQSFPTPPWEWRKLKSNSKK